MSIIDHLEALCGKGDLQRYQPLNQPGTDRVAKRGLFLTPEVFEQIMPRGQQRSPKMLFAHLKLNDVQVMVELHQMLSRFVTGRTMGFGEKRGGHQFKELRNSICVFKLVTEPHVRLIGGFAGLDQFVAMQFSPRAELDSGGYERAIVDVSRQWASLIGPIAGMLPVGSADEIDCCLTNWRRER